MAIAWPSFALLAQTILDGEPPADGFTFSIRQLGLLWRNTWLATVSAMGCVLIALPFALVLGNRQRKSYRPMIIAIFSSLLICPPMVYAFGWEKLLPISFDPYVRCILVWTLWLWPIPAIIIGAGWSQTGKSIFEAARMDTSTGKAFLNVAFSTLRIHIGVSFFIVFVLFFTSYDVPHACGLIVFSTELLGWAANSIYAIDTVWPAIPSMIIIGFMLTGIACGLRHKSLATTSDSIDANQTSQSHATLFFVLAGFTLSWFLPIGALLYKLNSTDVLLEAYQTYSTDLIWTMAVAVVSGLLTMIMGVGWLALKCCRAATFLWAIMLGMMPGALIGKSLIVAYNHSTSVILFDHWPIIVLGHVAHYGWIGIATAFVATRYPKPDILDQAHTDGADQTHYVMNILLPCAWPVLISGAGIVTALSIGEVATSSMLRVPDFSPISLVIIEKFHRFEDGMLISLSLFLVIASLPVVWLITWAKFKS